MDSCCVAAVRANGFFGGRIGSKKGNVFGSKNLGENGKKKLHLKPGVAYSVLTRDINKEMAALQFTPLPEGTPNANPASVASIILGGGAGTRLFPLTSRRSKPAVPIGGCYRLIDIPMSNCINSGIRKIFIMTQFNSFSLNRHLARTYNFGNGVSFGDGFVEVLAATQTPGETGKKWFQGTADAVRQFIWVFDAAKNKNIDHIVILSGDHLYRMDYMEFVQKHIDTGADITVSCVPMDDGRASDFGLMKIDQTGRIIQFAEKPKGSDLKAMQVDTSILGLSRQEAAKFPYIASMGVYVFKTDVLLQLLKYTYPSCNDFGSEIIPGAVNNHKVQARFKFETSVVRFHYLSSILSISPRYRHTCSMTTGRTLEPSSHYLTPIWPSRSRSIILFPPKFDFNDPKTPFYTSPRFLPPSKVEKCKIVDAITSHGCFLGECSVQHSIVGVRSRLDNGVELKDTMMMGADYYQTESEIASAIAQGKVPIGVGQNTKICNCIIDKNAKIGRDVIIANQDGVEEADRADDGFYIRSGITVVLKNATIKDGTLI
ncbi:hypothetical protein SASPL_106297 [Salvia splendens]|uniref:glucose-1-phosphate adenylyltransferase n=1 Tax=Salvia splendens TaxID=180675 RepID=A0A8X9A9G4_SALSN|nr:hypothetical protein SASPL_106297 [Salvia splendens]